MIQSFKPHQDLYYALLFSEPSLKQKAYALFQFFDEIESILPSCSESHIAKVKLSWWSQEIMRSYTQQATHPLSQALSPIIQECALPDAAFQLYLQAKIQECDHQPFPTLEDQIHFCQQAGANKILLLSCLCSPEPISAFALYLGTAFKLIDLIAFFGQDMRKNRWYFPKTDLDTRGLLQQQADNAKKLRAQAMAALPKAFRMSQAPLLILDKLYFTKLDEIEQDNFQVDKYQYHLTPFRKVWLSWRTYQTLKKGKML